jgi:hypothetical protein
MGKRLFFCTAKGYFGGAVLLTLMSFCEKNYGSLKICSTADDRGIFVDKEGKPSCPRQYLSGRSRM